MRTLVATSLLVGLAEAPALARVVIRSAEYAGGVLVVHGTSSRKAQPVSLDDRYFERTRRDGSFTFRVRYRPADCSVGIRAGAELQVAEVANCQAMRDLTPARDPASGSRAARFRAVDRTCRPGRACRVACQRDEYAINAFCLVGRARLVDERSVTCSEQAPNRIVAYCISTAGR